MSFSASFIYHYNKLKRERGRFRDPQNWGQWDHQRDGVVGDVVEKVSSQHLLHHTILVLHHTILDCIISYRSNVASHCSDIVSDLLSLPHTYTSSPLT